MLDFDPVQKRCKDVSFTSTSNGANRPKRKPRKVNLLVADEKIAYQVIRGELRSRQGRNSLGPDRLAEKILTDMRSEERTPDELLRRAIGNASIELEIKEVARRYNLNENLQSKR